MLEFLQAAEEAARIGGQVLRSWSSRFSVTEKSRANLVTEADHASQQAIFEFLSRRYPQHNFLGEEGLSQTRPGASFRWIIDPLDGTTNYVHQFPYYAVSIGLEREGELIAGAIYNPSTEEMFLAAAGHGATLNRKPIRCSQVDSLEQAMVIASLPSATSAADVTVQRFLGMLGQAQTVQRTGSAALNLAHMAAGHIDGFWSTSLYPWDMAAGVLMVREAGGLVTQFDGSEFDVNISSLLAANGPAVHTAMAERLQKFP